MATWGYLVPGCVGRQPRGRFGPPPGIVTPATAGARFLPWILPRFWRNGESRTPAFAGETIPGETIAWSIHREITASAGSDRYAAASFEARLRFVTALPALVALALVLACAAGALHYRRTAVRAPRLDANPSPFNRALLARLERLEHAYAPTPWLANPHLQLLWLLLCEAVAPALRFDRTDVLAMRDGGTTALDWFGLDASPATPTLLVLPSITGDAQSSRLIVRDLRRATGWRVVVCARRGHGGLALTAPVVNTMGCTDDLREQLARIRAQVPDSPLYAIGVSAGSALLVRYLGEEGPRSPIRAGVAYCPGYDIGVAWRRVPPFYSRVMAKRVKRHFLERHAAALRHVDGFDACLAARDLTQFHERLHPLAGCADLDDYLARSNPMRVFGDVTVPVMVVNADDDPVCVASNAEDHVEAITRIPDALMVRTARGSHCGFLEGWWPRSWGNRLMADYLLAADGLLRDRAEGNAARAGSSESIAACAAPTSGFSGPAAA
jgi:predicted alpha/beta-fold hydrolase